MPTHDLNQYRLIVDWITRENSVKFELVQAHEFKMPSVKWRSFCLDFNVSMIKPVIWKNTRVSIFGWWVCYINTDWLVQETRNGSYVFLALIHRYDRSRESCIFYKKYFYHLSATRNPCLVLGNYTKIRSSSNGSLLEFHHSGKNRKRCLGGSGVCTSGSKVVPKYRSFLHAVHWYILSFFQSYNPIHLTTILNSVF